MSVFFFDRDGRVEIIHRSPATLSCPSSQEPTKVFKVDSKHLRGELLVWVAILSSRRLDQVKSQYSFLAQERTPSWQSIRKRDSF